MLLGPFLFLLLLLLILTFLLLVMAIIIDDDTVVAKFARWIARYEVVRVDLHLDFR